MQPDLQGIRRGLGLRYGLFVAALLLVFALGVYGQVSQARRQLLRVQLQQLAATAAAELPLLQHEAEEMGVGHRHAALGEGRTETGLDGNGAASADHRILWFDDRLRELQQHGSFRPGGATIPAAAARGGSQWLPLSNGLALWRPVFSRAPAGGTPRLHGYVSVALAAAATEQELARLRHGLVIGALLASLLAFAAGQWLVAASLEPIQRQIERLIRFSADASHELRHPLTAIRAVIGSLRHGGALADCPPALVEKLGQIDQTTERMGRLVDDLLLLSRSDRAIADPLPWRVFPLEELLDDLIQLHQAEAEKAGIRLQAEIRGVAPVRGQSERLWQLLENLLANALRFSRPGGTITVGLEPQGRLVRLWVDDQGPGIPPAQRRLVFERFWQADAARSSSDHHGLGLSIAQAIAQAHGGRLQALESTGGGCRMLLELPLQT